MLYSVAQCRQLERLVYSHSTPVLAFIHSSPYERDPYQLPSHINDITNLLVDLRRLEQQVPPPAYRRLTIDLQHILDLLDNLQHHINDLVDGAPAPPGQQWEIMPGRRRSLVVDIEMLQMLAAEGMADWEIAIYLHCSLRTIKRRRKEAGIVKREWSIMSDDDIMTYILRCLGWGGGYEGEKGVCSGLVELGIKVPRDTVRRLLRNVDRGSLAIAPTAVQRRIYRVPWINALWHIDGHHKLIPWKIVIHGGIDGFSRMITFLRASDNNRAETVGECFEQAVRTYGWPNRVRADYGKENWDVKRAMERVRGENRGSFIQGPSTRNQRIERLWVDLQQWCTNRYRQIFLYLEDQHLLHPDNPFQLWALHFCFLPMLNKALQFFIRRWNSHGIRTVRNNSPRLIWIRNRMQAARAGLDPLQVPEALLGEDDSDLERHRRLNFQDYGVEDYGGRASKAPQDTDPYVVVEPVLDVIERNVGTWMASEMFLQEMAVVAGPAWPPGEDSGIHRYVRVLGVLDERLRIEFPHLGGVQL